MQRQVSAVVLRDSQEELRMRMAGDSRETRAGGERGGSLALPPEAASAAPPRIQP